ncbi:MAG: lipopolysaccharide heptosyltransferase II [Syntrophobacteria bacterium]
MYQPVESVSPNQKILLIAPNWIGDAILCLPVVDASVRLRPEAELTVLARKEVSQVFVVREPSVRVLEFQRGAGPRRLKGLAELARMLREERFSLAIILPNSFSSLLLAWMAAIPQRAGYATDGRGLLLTHRLKSRRKERGLHQAEYYLQLIRSLGATEVDCIPRLSLRPRYRKKAFSLLGTLGIGEDETVVGVHPGAAYGETKRWFPQRFAAVLEKLQRSGRRILLLGGPGEESVANQISRKMAKPPISLVGRTSVAEALAVISRCALFLSNDSGLMHAAAALGVPQVALFGSTDPLKTAPLNELAVVIHPKEVSCTPCFKRHCPHNLECMKAITVEKVHTAAEQMLAKWRPQPTEPGGWR